MNKLPPAPNPTPDPKSKLDIKLLIIIPLIIIIAFLLIKKKLEGNNPSISTATPKPTATIIGEGYREKQTPTPIATITPNDPEYDLKINQIKHEFENNNNCNFSRFQTVGENALINCGIIINNQTINVNIYIFPPTPRLVDYLVQL